MRLTRAGALLLGAALLAPVALAATTLITNITNDTADPVHDFKGFDAPAAAVADFDGDGVPEIVAHNDNQYVYVLATTTPRVLAEFRTEYPSGWGVRPLNDPAVADVDNDGKLDIVVVNSAAFVCVYEFEGGSSTTSMTFEREWCDRMSDHGGEAADGGAKAADVDGDGRMEIFANTETKGLYAYNHDGSVRWSKDLFGGNAGPLVTDLENDGRLEVLFFSDGGTVRAFDASSGGSKWTFHASKYVWPASIPVAGNAADLDGDGDKEVVFTARDAHDDSNFDNNHLMIFVLNDDGDVVWRAQPSWGNPMSYTHPVLIDVDGDGRRDVLLQDWNTIGHKPGEWQRLGPANVFAYRGHDGLLLWRTELDNSWSNDDLAVANVDGDGAYEVLGIGYDSGGNDGIWYLDLRTGAKEAHVDIGSGWQMQRGPVAGNLDGSGKTSWAAPIDKSGSHEGGWRVFRTDAACDVAFGGWQNEFGCDGGSGGGTPPPPPPTGEFDASFTPRNGNEWWIQVKVDANQALSGVQTSINGGDWRSLQLKDWGDWAASYPAPEGSSVRFRATATTGETDLSGCYRWTSMTPIECGGTTPPEGGGATFTHGGGNEWWVEVKVSPHPSAVEAMDTGGGWVALEFKDWDEWAGSFHIEPGHQVRFRAMLDGAWVESCWYSHPAGVSQCDGGSGFDATFSNVRGNEWWVETDVSASGGTLAGVDARVNGGDWFALSKTDWGSWAANRNVGSGVSVEFRARSTDGQTDVSSAYAWPPG